MVKGVVPGHHRHPHQEAADYSVALVGGSAKEPIVQERIYQGVDGKDHSGECWVEGSGVDNSDVVEEADQDEGNPAERVGEDNESDLALKCPEPLYSSHPLCLVLGVNVYREIA